MWNLSNYEDVNSRIKRFREKYPNSSILTQMVEFDVSKGIALVHCEIWKDRDSNGRPDASDYAFGDVASFSPNMKKWFVEDTVTSAIGRAIALILDVDNKATKQNMQRAETIEIEKANDPWTTEAKVMPIKAEQAVETIQAVMTETEEIPTCEHGKRKLIEGVKNNKPYRGYVCTGYGDPKCEAMWMHISKTTGKWEFN